MLLYTTVQKFRVCKFFKFKEINTFIQQVCVKWTVQEIEKSDCKDIYHVTADFSFYAFELYIHQRIIKNTTIYSKDIKHHNKVSNVDNKRCFFSTKAAY